jgi:hypothetical protein
MPNNFSLPDQNIKTALINDQISQHSFKTFTEKISKGNFTRINLSGLKMILFVLSCQ